MDAEAAFVFQPMQEQEARANARWHYPGPCSFYDMEQDPEDLEEFLNPESWPGRTYAVLNERGELVGFFTLKEEGNTVEIGLGLRPDLTGKGMGLAFVRAGLDFARRHFSPQRFSLAVATFNQRAIRVYERAGFRPTGVSIQPTNGGEHEFARMIREV